MTSAEIQELKEFLSEEFGKVRGEMTEMRGDISGLQTGLAEVRADISEVREDVSGLKTGLAEVRGEMTEMRGDISGLQTGLEEVRGELSELRGELSELRRDHHRFADHVASHFQKVHRRMHSTDDRLARVEVVQEKMAHDFKALAEQVTTHDARLDDLRSEMRQGFKDVREEMGLGFQAWGARVEALETRLEGRLN